MFRGSFPAGKGVGFGPDNGGIPPLVEYAYCHLPSAHSLQVVAQLRGPCLVSKGPLDVVCDSKNVVVCSTTAGGWVQGILFFFFLCTKVDSIVWIKIYLKIYILGK